MIISLIEWNSRLAVAIACLGLFGLASFMTEQRRKEIGIRKVLGASVSGISFLMTKEFTKWVLLANVFAWPAAYIVMTRWLQNFVYKVEVSWKIFLLSAVIAILISLVTVGCQSIKAALTNPVDTLKHE